jgi:hypothetical protein
MTLWKALIVALTMFPGAASADDYTLTFSDSDMQLLNDALTAMPYGKIAPLIAKIQKQVSDAQREKANVNANVAQKPLPPPAGDQPAVAGSR